MMRTKTTCLTLAFCLTALSLVASADVTDPNVIAAVTRYNSTLANPVLVKGGLGAGARIFVDRDTFFYSDAGIFKGLDYIQTAMDDKTNADVQYEVGFLKPGTLYLIIDNRVGDNNAADAPTLGNGVMDWVNTLGFVQTPYTLGFSEPATVYSLPVGTDPNKITLGAQNNTSTRAMYAITAAPAGWNLPPQILGIPATATVALPNTSLAINGSVVDDGIPGTGVSVEWTVVSKPDGATIDFAPGMTVANPTVTMSDAGVYSLKMTASDGGKTSEKIIDVTLSVPLFALQAVGNVEIGNDGSLAPTTRSSGTGLGARNIDTRRRVAVISYNLNSARDPEHPEEAFANAFFSVRTQTRGGVTTVYGVKEHLDNFTVSSTSWNTCPGVFNSPTPALNSPVTLDLPDLVGPLMVIAPPAVNTRASTAPSPELTEFLNSDNDGVVVFLFVGLANGTDNNIYYSSRSTTAGSGYPNPSGTGELFGVVLGGERRIPISATKPQPTNFGNASPSLTQLCWTNPLPSQPEGQITCDVYFGSAEPNALLPHYGLQKIAAQTTGTCVALPYALTAYKTYYWMVDVYDSSRTPNLTEGMLWQFSTDNAAPIVNAGADQYLWLNNAGDPAAATVNLAGTVTDDGLPSGTLTRLWTQASGPAQIIDPNGVIIATQVTANTNNISLVLPAAGTYQFVLTANDSAITSSDTVQVVVATTPCLAAKATPGYAPITGDIDGDCFVNLNDLAVFATHWLECNSLAPCY